MKYLGIGFPRTGTTSLIEAFTIMGFKSSKDQKKESFSYNDFTCDGLIHIQYKKILTKNPNLKCILTTRKPEDWIKSLDWLFETHLKNRHNKLFYMQYSVPKVRGYEDVLIHKFKEHQKDVESFFKDKPEQLLIIDLSLGDN